jgi:hypothetical protein
MPAFLSSDFTLRVERLKLDFDSSIKSLLKHQGKQREDLVLQNERKLEVLKGDIGKLKNELVQLKTYHER